MCWFLIHSLHDLFISVIFEEGKFYAKVSIITISYIYEIFSLHLNNKIRILNNELSIMNNIKIITILILLVIFPSTHSLAACLLDEDLNSYSVINGMSDAEANGWTHYTDFGIDSWRVLTAAGVSFSNAFSVAEETQASLLGITDSFLVTPELILSGQYYLIFSHKYDFEADSSYYDGGQLQITTNGGNSWTDMNQFITSGGYNETISNSFASPIRGQLAWAGEQENFTTVEVDLTSFTNQTIQIRWRFVSGIDSIAQLGWRIDDIKVTESLPSTEIIFKNSFEHPDPDEC